MVVLADSPKYGGDVFAAGLRSPSLFLFHRLPPARSKLTATSSLRVSMVKRVAVAVVSFHAQSHVLRSAARRARVFVGLLRWLVLFTRQSSKATKSPCTRPPHPSWAGCFETVSSCLSARTTEQRVEWRAEIRVQSDAGVTTPYCVGLLMRSASLSNIWNTDAGSPGKRSELEELEAVPAATQKT